MSSGSNTPPDDFFNDLSQTGNSKSGPNKRRRSPNHEDSLGTAADTDNGMPKQKRIACVICRKRKLKCDGSKPSCSTCTRLGHSCAYDEVRRKSGPKRGYVKALEERLKQVETLLKTQEPSDKVPDLTKANFAINNNNPHILQAANSDFDVANPHIVLTTERDTDRWGFTGDSPHPPLDDMTFNPGLNMDMTMDGTNFTWEMIGLGLEEPLPPQETIDELHQIYFDKIHPSIPMIHKYRYLAAMNLAPNQRPPVALRYAIWTVASSITDSYLDLKEHFYQRARKYLELDYLKGHGEHIMSVGHAQAHILLASYEFKMMYFPRAWMNTGAGVRLCQMLGLHRLDGVGLDVKQCLLPPRDWTEREERRRTFWMAFCEDRYASIGTGWPMTIDEKDILTNLPASDEAFERSKEEPTRTLQESMSPSGANSLSSFGSIVLMACLFGRNLVHLHRPDPDDCDNDLNGEFWKRHRHMDNILLNTSLSLPNHLKLPNGLSNPNVVFTNMNIHTSTICLHQAAIYKADKNRLPAGVSKESKLRCINAANEIASIMRMICHLDLSAMNPFISFCLYVAARVFVQYLKSHPEDNQTGDSLRFLLSAMNTLKVKNPLTESFLVQLDVDLESLGLRNPKFKSLAQGLYNPNSPNHFGYIDRKDKTGDGHIDQCNFLKIVDDVKSPIVDPAVDPSLNEPLSWLSGSTNSLPTRGQVHPVRMDGILQNLRQGASGQAYDQPRNLHGHMSGYGQGESSPNVDLDLSSDQNPSDRPTPSSSTASSLQPGHGQTGHSGQSSFDASPVASHQAHPDTSRTANAFFGHTTDFSGVGGTGLTPGATFSVPETPGRGDFTVPNGWEMNGRGMTPIGEGLIQQLMGLGPMDISWDGSS